MKLKTVHVPRGYDGLHLEIPGAIINIHTQLTNVEGQRVVNVSITCDAERRGETPWRITYSRAYDYGASLLIVEQTPTITEQRNRAAEAAQKASETP